MSTKSGANEAQVVCHPEDEDWARDPAFASLVTPGNALARELTGAHAYSGSSVGFPTKALLGHCRLCGSFRQLTFEHLPPKSAGNASKRRYASALEILRAQDIAEFPSEGVVIQQRGSGFYLLCKECNELLSNLGYVEEYRNLVGATAHAMADFIGDLPDDEALPEKVRLQVGQLYPGRIVRQALAMAMCASGSPHFGNLFPGLRDCVVNGTPTELPLGMSLHVAIVAGPRARFVPPIVAIDRASSEWQVLLEATFAPLSWVLRLSNSPPNLSLADVSDWTKLRVDDQLDFEIETQAGFVFGAVPLDYRHVTDFSQN
jgi:hypothetical protein